MKDLDYFERLTRDLSDARNIQVKSNLSLSVDNAMNKTISDLNDYFKSEIEASRELGDEVTELISGLGSNVISIVSNVKSLYFQNSISVKSKIEILNEMLLIADDSAKREREKLKNAVKEELSIETEYEKPNEKKERPRDIRRVGERPVSIKEKRSKVLDEE